jgi:hypothetical protein
MGANDLSSRQDSPESTSKVLYLPGRDPLGRYQNGEDRQWKTLKAARKRICLDGDAIGSNFIMRISFFAFLTLPDDTLVPDNV